MSGGKLAKDAGKTFEKILELRCHQFGLGFKKIPDGCYRANFGGKVKLIPMKTPFDFIICKDGKAATLDCKTINSDRFAFSQIDESQLKHLSDMGEHLASGYLIWFRATDHVVFFSHKKLMQLTPGNSLTECDGFSLGLVDFFNPEHILDMVVKPELQGNLL